MRILTDKLISLVNYRIEQEEISSRLYKAMAIYLEYNGYSGAAKLWNKYSHEEQTHAEWAYNYMLDLDHMPNIPTIPAPQSTFTGLVDVIQKSYDHEIKITNQCQDLASEAFKAGDWMTVHFAQHYLDEQVEELKKTKYWLDRINAFGTDSNILFELDEEMGEA